MIKDTLIKLLRKIADELDAGNSNMTESEMLDVIEQIQSMNDSNSNMSKYEACQYLHVSRPTFDRLIADGRIPQGKKRAGLKELLWNKKDLKL